MKKVKSYKNIKKIKKKKNNNSLKKIQIKTPIKNLRIQQKIYIKETADIYIKKIVKNLNKKTFKHYIYTKHYNDVLDLVRNLKPEKASNITFNKKPRISKKYLI